MFFHPRVILLAGDRQSKMDGMGSWCARCGVSLVYKKEEAVPRKPFNEGGRKTPDNCVLFCPECYSKIKEPGKTEITFNTIPYYNSVPPEWWREYK